MPQKQKKSLGQALSWWWRTRVLGFWRVGVLGKQRREALKREGCIAFKQDGTPLSPNSDGITVILTAYKRAEYLADQIAALRAQSVPPQEIWVWSNRSDHDLLDVSSLADRVIVSNSNWLFWGRFAQAMLVRTKYVAFFDDDILPQVDWFKNCLAVLAQEPNTILGGSGVILPTTGGYSSKHKAGWNGKHLDKTVPVDLVGHAWFMDKKQVQYMWREEPITWDNGEDIHLSFMALKHGGVETKVPPHPENKEQLWSCRPDFGKRVGRLKVATYQSTDHKDTRSQIVDHYREQGWQLAVERYDAQCFVADEVNA